MAELIYIAMKSFPKITKFFEQTEQMDIGEYFLLVTILLTVLKTECV